MKFDRTFGWSAKNSASTAALSNPDIGPQSRPSERAASIRYAPCNEELRNALARRSSSLPLNQLLLLQPVEHAGHGTAVHVAFTGQCSHGVGPPHPQQDQRFPLHGRELQRLHAGIDVADQGAEHQLEQPAHLRVRALGQAVIGGVLERRDGNSHHSMPRQ